MYPANYECEGQLNIWDYLGQLEPKQEKVCDHSGHTCNKEELYKVAVMDGMACPKKVCCRYCKIPFCGARCNGSEEPQIKPDDSICEGCKWRDSEGRELKVDWHGQTWVYKCAGTACANWKHGTPLNLTFEAESIAMPEYDFQERSEFPECYNRDFLPELPYIIGYLKETHGLEFDLVKCDWDESLGMIYQKKLSRGTLELYDSKYQGTNQRFVSIDYQSAKEGFAAPCDNLDRIFKSIDKAFIKDEEIRKRGK